MYESSGSNFSIYADQMGMDSALGSISGGKNS